MREAALKPRQKILTDKPLEFSPGEPDWKAPGDWVLEIGPGKGEFLLWLAKEQPKKNFVGLEIKKRRFQKISKKVESLEIKNVTMVRGDARLCLLKLLPEGHLTEAFVLFPDPWPKRRHHKHRLLNLERTEELYRLLKPGGAVWVATDDPHYAGQIEKVFPKEKWSYTPGRSLYPTYFETKWKNLGRSIHYFCFGKSK